MTGTIYSFREVNFATMGINFLMVFNPSALINAPATNIATIYAPKKYETEIKNYNSKFPNVTSVSVGETVKKVKDIILKSSLIIKCCAALIIFLGFFVIIEHFQLLNKIGFLKSSILKTLGASKKIILLSILLRSVIIGSFAGLVAIILGAIMCGSHFVFFK